MRKNSLFSIFSINIVCEQRHTTDQWLPEAEVERLIVNKDEKTFLGCWKCSITRLW